MEEIDIGQMLGYFKSKIIYIIFAMSIAFCIASIYVNRFRVPEYTSYTTILINKTNETEINTNDLTRDKSLVSTYGEIIKSKMVLRAVINNLSLEMDYSELAAKVTVSSVTDTSIIKISVADSDSGLAASIANEIATVFAREIVDIYNIENISIIDVAEISEVPSSISTIKIIGIATIAGAVVAVAVIFVLFYFDTTIKNEEDIERVTGLPVIGVVPISREKIKGSAHRKYYQEKAKKHKTQEILPVEREVRKIEVEKVYKEPELVSEPIESPIKEEVIDDEVLNDEIYEEEVVDNVTYEEPTDLTEAYEDETVEDETLDYEKDVEDDLSITKVLTDVANAIQAEEKAKKEAEETTDEEKEELSDLEENDDDYVNKHGNTLEEEENKSDELDSIDFKKVVEVREASSIEEIIKKVHSGNIEDIIENAESDVIEEVEETTITEEPLEEVDSNEIEVPHTKENKSETANENDQDDVQKEDDSNNKKNNQNHNNSRNKGKNNKKKNNNSKK